MGPANLGGAGYYGFTWPQESLADILGRSATSTEFARLAKTIFESPPPSWQTPLTSLVETVPAHPNKLQLHWHQCIDPLGNMVWGTLAGVDLSSEHFLGREGVYLIWLPMSNWVVRIGQGTIKDRLREHRDEWWANISGYDLSVSWADVASKYRDGVERFLAERLRPIIGTRFPDETPIEVNLPL